MLNKPSRNPNHVSFTIKPKSLFNGLPVPLTSELGPVPILGVEPVLTFQLNSPAPF
jgi:hypothetical protein